MEDSTELRKHIPPPLRQVRKFVTRTWEHPLVDGETRKHREQARTRLSDILMEHDVNPDIFITIPVGSLIWAADEESDYDYQLVVRNEKDSRKISRLFAEAETNGFQDIYSANKVNLVDFSIGDELKKRAHKCVGLLFTPDEYIGGNIELARQLRFEVVNQMKDRGFTEDDWKWIIEHRFDIFFRKWDDLSLHLSGQYKGEKSNKSRDRALRVLERLERRSQLTHNPEKYKAAFKNARDTLQFPGFETYSQAITSSNGALNILTEYSATGIN